MKHIEPIGLALTRTGRVVSKAFDEALSAVGGSLPVWLILMALQRAEHSTQRDIATSVGIEEATLTHHLARMEQSGLVGRHRSETNRRVQIVTLTSEGHAAFVQMLATVREFDKRLRRGLSTTEVEHLASALSQLRTNAGSNDKL